MIIVSLQAGDPASGRLYGRLYRRLNQLLTEHCSKPYSDPTENLAILLCVSGGLDDFQFEGCDRLRRSRKHREIGVDIGIPQHRWNGAPEEDVRAHLFDQIERATELFVSRLQRDKEPVRADDLKVDLGRVKEAFMADLGGAP